ncbi:MAG: HD domain-containing protein [Candidatus Portnoybacteria bacterium]|nr:HD domain-containing protein [Candidatus Portnoybacteria bacterium]
MKIPKEIKDIIQKLNSSGFEAFVVGGCVRDLLMGREPKDWDIATNAKPEEIQRVFPESFYTNKFGTVTIKTNSKKDNLREIEATTYRIDEKYTDKRHPDSVKFTNELEKDLARRDFTINAMALTIGEKSKIRIPFPPLGGIGGDFENTKSSPALPKGRESRLGWKDLKIIDPFNGQKDLKDKLIRAVGKAEDRFSEDALRMMRAIRFACQLDFSIEPKTFSAIQKNAAWIQAIAKERIKDELSKIMISDKASEGVELLKEAGLLRFIIPELEKGIGVTQNRHHIFTVYEHCVLSLKFAAEKKFNLEVRLAALLHDIGKPQVKRGEGPDATFYNHDFVSAKFAARILERLRFPNQTIEKVALLIRNHMFVYEVGVVTEAAIRRLLKKVGPENMPDLIDLRVADRLGSGVPKAQPYRLRHFQYLVEKVQHDAISVKMLKINGNDIMKTLKIEPGPKIGAILDVLLAEAIEEPEKNEKKYLEARVKELNKLDLLEIRKIAKQKIEEKKEEEDSEIKGKYWVK